MVDAKKGNETAKHTSFGNPRSRTTTLTKSSSSGRVRLSSSAASRRYSRIASGVLPCDNDDDDGGVGASVDVDAEDVG